MNPLSLESLCLLVPLTAMHQPRWLASKGSMTSWQRMQQGNAQCGRKAFSKRIDQLFGKPWTSFQLLRAAATIGFLAGALPLGAPVEAMPASACRLLSSSPTVLKDGFKWSEGPAWLPLKERWVFSDVMGDKQFTITADGKLEDFRTPSGYANGNAVMKNGMVASAQHDRKLVELTPSGKVVGILADTYNGKKLNSPNDVAVAADGSLWFTDPPLGITGYGPKKEPQELSFQGVFRLQGKKLTVMDDSLDLPNGIGFSPNGKELYISDTKTSSIVRFNVDSRTSKLSDKTTFASLKRVPGGGKEGAADGLRVDRKGNIWASGPGGITVLSAKGKTICQIPFENHVSNMSFGGRDGRSMVITSADKLYILSGAEKF